MSRSEDPNIKSQLSLVSLNTFTLRKIKTLKLSFTWYIHWRWSIIMSRHWHWVLSTLENNWYWHWPQICSCLMAVICIYELLAGHFLLWMQLLRLFILQICCGFAGVLRKTGYSMWGENALKVTSSIGINEISKAQVHSACVARGRPFFLVDNPHFTQNVNPFQPLA